MENGPCQPLTCRFSVIEIGGGPRRFILEWFDEFGGWLEYSESKDRAYCFCYFLFRRKKNGGYETFVQNGWNGYHRKERLRNHVIDWLLQELDGRFNETSSELLVCSATFSPRDSFHDFNMEKLMSLAKLYPHDFDSGNSRDLSHELGLYIFDVRDDDRFSNMQTIAELFQKMVATGKYERYPMVYRLLKLVLVLPVVCPVFVLVRNPRLCSSAPGLSSWLVASCGDRFLSAPSVVSVLRRRGFASLLCPCRVLSLVASPSLARL